MRLSLFYTITIIFLSVNQSDSLTSYFHCKYNECCDEPWIINNITNLSLSLKEHVFGQHLVQSSVPKLIRAHLDNPLPQKPLVLSFHGSTGTGKSWVSRIISENLYLQGWRSKFVKHIHVPFMFRDTLRTRETAEQLHHKILSSLETCKQTLFIFDDIHTMDPKILDELVMYLNYPPPLDDIIFTKAIYLLLSNAGAPKINDYVTEQFVNDRERISLTSNEMHQIISDDIYREKGAFQETDFVRRQVIDAAIPFLPLERCHVEMCVKRAIRERGRKPTQSVVNEVLRDVRFVPEGLEKFSAAGCKRVDAIISDYLE